MLSLFSNKPVDKHNINPSGTELYLLIGRNGTPKIAFLGNGKMPFK